MKVEEGIENPLLALPPCVERVRVLCDELHKAVLNPEFPDLDVEPSSTNEIQAVFKQARTWAANIDRVYGTEEIGAPQDNLQKHFRITRTAPFAVWNLREVSDALHRLSCGENIPSLIVQMERVVPAFNLGCAADVLGNIPEHLQRPGTVGLPGQHSIEIRPAAGQRGESRPIAVVPENWPHIRATLRAAHITILSRVLGLVAWMRERITVLENSLLPSIRRLRELERYRVEIEITQAGARHVRELQDEPLRFLRQLAQQGTATTNRKTKKRLVDCVPELRPWIDTVPSRPGTSANDMATYSIPAALQVRISVEDATPQGTGPKPPK
jgi:hypothetical protein